MIAKSIAVCGALLLGYSMMLSFSPELSASQAEWQRNLHKAERFLYADGNPRAVIIGTSLAARLRLERVAGYENVSFSGLSIFDGLSVLRHKDKLPSVVYIETNGLLRTRDRNFSETLFAPVPFLLRRHVIALRADKQPLALIGQSFGIALRKRGRQIKHELFGISSSVPAGDDEAVPMAPDERMLALQIRDLSDAPNETLLTAQLQLLRTEVSYLMSKGVAITFFEMPLNPKLVTLPRARVVRDAMHDAFHPGRFHYIELPADSASYVTTDGIHLTSREADHYTCYFLERAAELGDEPVSAEPCRVQNTTLAKSASPEWSDSPR